VPVLVDADVGEGEELADLVLEGVEAGGRRLRGAGAVVAVVGKRIFDPPELQRCDRGWRGYLVRRVELPPLNAGADVRVCGAERSRCGGRGGREHHSVSGPEGSDAVEGVTDARVVGNGAVGGDGVDGLKHVG